MRQRITLLSLLVLGLLSGGGRAQQPAPTTRESALAVMTPYIGDWTIKATWGGGAPLEARATYTWGLNKKFIVARTFVKQADGTEYQRYESVFGEENGQVVCHSFVFSGEASVRTWQRDGAKLSNEWISKGADGDAKFRQSVELVDNDHIRWLVAREKDGKWESIMDGTWERVRASAAK
jgi:hypothetical protein